MLSYYNYKYFINMVVFKIHLIITSGTKLGSHVWMVWVAPQQPYIHIYKYPNFRSYILYSKCQPCNPNAAEMENKKRFNTSLSLYFHSCPCENDFNGPNGPNQASWLTLSMGGFLILILNNITYIFMILQIQP